jgi:hypothetical protein
MKTHIHESQCPRDTTQSRTVCPGTTGPIIATELGNTKKAPPSLELLCIHFILGLLFLLLDSTQFDTSAHNNASGTFEVLLAPASLETSTLADLSPLAQAFFNNTSEAFAFFGQALDFGSDSRYFGRLGFQIGEVALMHRA